MIFYFGKLEFKNFLNVTEKLVVAQNSKSQVLKKKKKARTNKKPHNLFGIYL